MHTIGNKIAGIAQLVRLPNLLIIILTQLLLRYAILEPFLFTGTVAGISPVADFLLLVLLTVLIAAGGYVINDYFDVKIDTVNKPDKMVIDKVITARGAIMLHLILNGIATMIGFYLAWRVKSLSFGLIFPFLGILLWFYSARYKRTILWGNIIVAFLSAFVILIVWLFEFFHLRLDPESFVDVIRDLKGTTYIFLAYGIFAFLVTMFREILKDMEDWEGDEKYGCKTLPLAVGIRRSKIVVVCLMVLNMALLAYAMVVLRRIGLNMAFWYFLAAIQLPVLYLIISVIRAKGKKDYHAASILTKIIMLAGILSMQVISLNF